MASKLRGGLEHKPTQVEKVIKYLKDFGSITSLQAFNDLGITQLGARIFEAKKRYGYEIDGDFIRVKNRYGEKCSIKRYTLRSKPDDKTGEQK